MTKKIFDVIIIGNGLLGSSVTEALANDNLKVALIGQPEPKEYYNHTGVFSSHYDESRITRTLDIDLNRTNLAVDSTKQAAYLEKKTDISFFKEVGHLSFFTAKCSKEYSSISSIAKKCDVEYEELDLNTCKKKFPFFNLSEGKVLYQAKNSGYLDPRKMILANNLSAKNAGAHIFNFLVTHIHPCKEGFICKSDTELFGKKIILATGSFLESIDLSSVTKQTPTLTPRSVKHFLFEISSEDEKKLTNMPSVIYKTLEYQTRFYVLPPLRSKNGKTYLKIGHSLPANPIDSLKELKQWFQGVSKFDSGTPTSKTMENNLQKLFPNISFKLTSSARCTTTHTPHGQPYICSLKDNSDIICLLGGNAYAAKSALCLGSLAAKYVKGEEWPDKYDTEDFVCVYD